MLKDIRQRAKGQQQALLKLSKNQWLAGHNAVLESIQLATEVAAKTLAVQRCSVWLYDELKSSIRCFDLYDASKNEHESGAVLNSSDFPRYFEALLKQRIIPASDAETNPFTCEFTDSYLKPNGISAMLDAPIWLGGNTIGVFCCEHVGKEREWEIDEENFAASVADFASIAFELAKHRQTSDELRQHKDRLESTINERTKELSLKNQELEAFTYSVSHDLRVPLRSILGYIDILVDDYSEQFDNRANDLINRVKDGASNLSKMIDSLLTLSRISSQKLVKTELNLTEMMKVISDQLIANNKAIKIMIYDTPKSVGDAGLIQIALMNLLENSLKYTRSTSRPLIEFGSSQINGRTEYFLKDNGCGFDMTKADRLFTAFERLHAQNEYPGNGIGLSTVRRIVMKHGGDIRGEGEVGKGAIFRFTLSE